MGMVRLELLQPALHGFDLALEQIILLTGIVCVLRIVLQATELGMEALFSLLAAADVVDGWTDACVSSVDSFVMGSSTYLWLGFPIYSLLCRRSQEQLCSSLRKDPSSRFDACALPAYG